MSKLHSLNFLIKKEDYVILHKLTVLLGVKISYLCVAALLKVIEQTQKNDFTFCTKFRHVDMHDYAKTVDRYKHCVSLRIAFDIEYLDILEKICKENARSKSQICLYACLMCVYKHEHILDKLQKLRLDKDFYTNMTSKDVKLSSQRNIEKEISRVLLDQILDFDFLNP